MTPIASHRAVLLIDDSADTLEMYALGLGFAGYRALTATGADDARGQITRERPDAIVTELRFPGGPDGWDLIREIRSNPTTAQIPVVILTGYGGNEAASASRGSGVTLVTKPCAPEDLAKILERVLLASSQPINGDQ